MSSLKKHFAHFGSHHQHSNPHHDQQHEKHSPESSVSNSLQPGSHRQPPTATCFPYPPLDDSGRDLSGIDAVSFKADVLSCLDLCSSYIQALNNLCSAGAVLAQNLTQVFSPDVSPPSAGLQPAGKTGSRRRRLGLKSGLVTDSRAALAHPTAASDSDSIYYDMTEQFLRVWEMMSVSTAGASATIKTETLMTLQEVVNQLESPDPYGDNGLSGSGDRSPDMRKSIESAKSCLLAYIELQAQFSYNSWKSLNHLSKALKSDASMTDVVKNIKQHFDFRTKSPVAVTESPADATSSRSEDVSQESSQLDASKKKTSSGVPVRNVSGLKEAMDLLSLEGRARSSKRRRKSPCKKERRERRNNSSSKRVLNKSSGKENIAASNVMTATRLTHLGDKCFSSSRVESADACHAHAAAVRSQSTSTWPGKGLVNASGPGDRHDKNQTLSPDPWSLWSSRSPSFTNPNSCTTAPSISWRDCASQDMCWKVFPTHSSQSLSSSNMRTAAAAMSASPLSGSGASSNVSIGVPSTTSSSVATNRSYDLFAPMQKNPVSYYNGTHSLKGAHASSLMISNNNNNNNDSNFEGFGSLNDILDLERATSATAAVKRFSSGDVRFESQCLSSLNPGGGRNRTSTLCSSNYDRMPAGSATLTAPQLPDSVRVKTSTWPLKQESLSSTACPLLNHSPSSTQTNSNWVGVCSAPFNYSSVSDEHPFDNGPHDRHSVTQSLWSFDGAEAMQSMQKQLLQQHLRTTSHQQHGLQINKADVSRFAVFEANNNCGLSDKNF